MDTDTFTILWVGSGIASIFYSFKKDDAKTLFHIGALIPVIVAIMFAALMGPMNWYFVLSDKDNK